MRAMTEQPPDTLRAHLFGRFELECDGRAVTAWEGRLARDFVKLLILARGRPVGRDELVDRLWSDPPDHAERDLKVLVSRARRALGDRRHELILTTAGGYALATGRCWVDAEAMERLVKEARYLEQADRPALAEASYRAALELHRGPLLAEDLYADWAAAERERMHRLFVDATLALGGLLFRRGDPGALALAERALVEDPYSERALRAIMVAQTAAGDDAAALESYARFRQRLRVELGVAPAPETEAARRAILERRPIGAWPSLEAAARPPRPSASPARPLVGRVRELRALEDALEAAADGQAGLVLLGGEAGIGKSVLLEALTRMAADRFGVLEAAGKEGEQHLPFQLLSEALRRTLVGLDPRELGAVVGGYADAVAELAPELAAPARGLGAPSGSELARRRVLEGCLHVLRELARRRPLLVALDDVHWSDPSTIDAIRFCQARLDGARVLWALAVRSGEPGSERADGLASLPGARVIDLARMGPDELRQLLGDLAPDVSARIAGDSGGVPFYAVELARCFDPSGADTSIPSGIRQVLEQRLRRVSPAARIAVEAAAVLGDDVRPSALASLAEIGVGAALQTLEELAARRIVEDASRGGGFRFTHDLLRRTVYDGIGAARRQRLHARIVDQDLVSDPAVAGRHARRAGRAAQAAQLLRAAGEAALARLATREAEALLQAALDAARESQLDTTELLDRIGRARSARGDYAAAAEAHRAALRATADEQAAARQKIRLGWIAYYRHEPERAEALGRDAETAADEQTRSEALLLQAKVAHATGGVERAAAQLAEIARLNGGNGDAEARALEVSVANHRARFWEAALRFQGASAALRCEGLLRPLASGMLHAGIALAGRGEYVRALAVLEESRDLCREAGAEALLARVPNTLASIYRALGQWRRAAELDAESLDLSERSGMSEALGQTLVNLAEHALASADTAEARARIDRAAVVVLDPLVMYGWRSRLRWHLAVGRLALLEGRLADTLSAADELLVEARAAAAPKYEILALLERAEALGPRDGSANARAALGLARRLNAPPLILRAAAVLAGLTAGSESAALRQLADRVAESIAAPLPDDLRRTFLANHQVAV